MGFYLPAREVDDRLARGSVKIQGHGQHGNQGNREGSDHNRLSPEVKVGIAVLARLNGNRAASKVTGIHESTIGNLARGKNTSGREVDPEHKEKVEDRLEGIAGKASSALELAISGLLEPSRLAGTKAKDLAGIAANMSSVIERLRGKNNVVVAGQVVIMAPPAEKVSNYDVIEVESRVLD